MSFSTEVEFGNSPIGRRGYAKADVDAFVGRIAKTFAGKDDLTAAEVHHAMFAKPLIGKRGYDEREVDEFLDAVEEELVNRTGVRVHRFPAQTNTDEPATSSQFYRARAQGAELP